MPSKTHEDILVEALDILSKKGIRVIRLDTRELPDAFAVVDNKVLAIEVQTDGSPKYSKESQFDEIISLTPQIKTYDARIKAYLLAIRLRKEGKSYRQIKKYLHDCGVHVGLSTLHGWFRGLSLPPGITLVKGRKHWKYRTDVVKASQLGFKVPEK